MICFYNISKSENSELFNFHPDLYQNMSIELSLKVVTGIVIQQKCPIVLVIIMTSMPFCK